jgi:hypothetical protein
MPTRTNLDLDTLRAFSIVHEVGGMTQAADRLGRTPSAISLQMKRAGQKSISHTQRYVENSQIV